MIDYSRLVGKINTCVLNADQEMANVKNLGFVLDRAKLIYRRSKIYRKGRRRRLISKGKCIDAFLSRRLVKPEKTGDSFERRVHALWRLVIQNGN